jgi:hypothetical protein
LPVIVKSHSRDRSDNSRSAVTFEWAKHDVGALPSASEVVTMREFIAAKQSADWRSVIRSFRDGVAFSTCLNRDPSFPRPVGRQRTTADGLWRSTLRTFAREFPRHRMAAAHPVARSGCPQGNRVVQGPPDGYDTHAGDCEPDLLNEEGLSVSNRIVVVTRLWLPGRKGN